MLGIPRRSPPTSKPPTAGRAHRGSWSRSAPADTASALRYRQREKPAPVRPPRTPSAATHPSWAVPARLRAGRDNDSDVPSRWWESTVEDTQASTTNVKASTVKSTRTTSMAKKAPASGALKAAAMPAAVPAAARSRTACRGNPRRRPNRLALLAPSSAIGPSGPTDPPPPMVSTAQTTVVAAGPGAMTPSEALDDHSTPATPCPVGARPGHVMRGPMTSPDSTGAATMNHRPKKESAPVPGPRDSV